MESINQPSRSLPLNIFRLQLSNKKKELLDTQLVDQTYFWHLINSTRMHKHAMSGTRNMECVLVMLVVEKGALRIDHK